MGRKIAIISPAGAGKSTLARTLGLMLGIKVLYLDRYFWLPNWTEKPKYDRLAILRQLIQEEQWIIEGTYFTTSDIRLKEADTIVFLDMPLLLCLCRILWRRIVYSKRPRPDLPDGCPERLSLRYLLKVLIFPYIGRKTIIGKIGAFQGEKTIEKLCSPKAVEAFLEKQMKLVNENKPALISAGIQSQADLVTAGV